jgi:hypothetical protein
LDVIIVEKPNFPLLLHSESLILEEYNSSKEFQYQKMAEAHLQQLQLVSSQFDQSVARINLRNMLYQN